MRQALAWIVAGLAGLALLVASAVLLFNFYAERQWEKTRAEIDSRGETFNIDKLVPAPVPDEQNFAITPLLRPLLDYQFDWKTKQATWRDPEGKARAEGIRLNLDDSSPPSSNDWIEGDLTDLDAWAGYFRNSAGYAAPMDMSAADTVLAALGRFDSALDEIAQAARREHAHFPVHYEEGPYTAMPHLSVMANLAKILSLRASARLAAG